MEEMKGNDIDKERKISGEKEINMAIDPVCLMEVNEKTAPAKSEYKGKTYYFCAKGCKIAFDKNPEKYLKSDNQIRK